MAGTGILQAPQSSPTAAERQRKLAECEHALEIDIAKNRDGTTGTVSLFCDTACNAVRDLETVRIP